jgi:thiol:disulfide interchange protein DsbD
LNADLPIGAANVVDGRWQPLFDAARQAQPMRTNWQAQWAEQSGNIALVVDDGGVIKDLDSVQVFPQSPTLIAHAGYQIARLSSGALSIVNKKSDNFEAPSADVPIVLAEGRGNQRHVFQFQLAYAPSAAVPSPAPAHNVPSTHGSADQSVAVALVLALVGGMLLNLMPCVLPVLSLKALALAEHSHDRAQARRHGLQYLAGTLTCFVALATVLLALRAAGEALGWGFQLQVPWVVAALAMLMTVMGLSLAGVFQLGSSWMGFGQSFTEGSSGRSAFFSGALAAVVASPCTAPFMGPALGFAITQSVPIALGVFVALATGLALPVVALSFAPALGRWLPRPGAWMERFKQVLAYPMYLTAIWLLWVLGRQLGADGMALTLLAVVALVFGLWLWQSSSGRWFGKTAAVVSLAVAAFVVFSLPHVPEVTGAARAANESQSWRPWSPQALGELRAQGRPVLVNMTAAWCITCLANERVALSSSTVQNRLKSLQIAYLKGDWTHRDAQITEYLSQFGRNGVPLYVVYPSGDGEPEVLPQLLTPAVVEAALQRAANSDRVAHSLP